MTDMMLRTAVTTQTLIADLRERVQKRLEDQQGQVSIEWVGILALVGSIVALIVGLGLQNTLRDKVDTVVKSIFAGGGQ
jgi:putative Mn2+ efflux pump MntP